MTTSHRNGLPMLVFFEVCLLLCSETDRVRSMKEALPSVNWQRSIHPSMIDTKRLVLHGMSDQLHS